MNVGQAFAKEDPTVNNDAILFRTKFEFNFTIEGKVFFKTQYVIATTFIAQDTEKVLELLKDEELKDFFLKKQVNRTLWTVLRGTVMDAFNRHSLKPVSLPWMM